MKQENPKKVKDILDKLKEKIHCCVVSDWRFNNTANIEEALSLTDQVLAELEKLPDIEEARELLKEEIVFAEGCPDNCRHIDTHAHKMGLREILALLAEKLPHTKLEIKKTKELLIEIGNNARVLEMTNCEAGEVCQKASVIVQNTDLILALLAEKPPLKKTFSRLFGRHTEKPLCKTCKGKGWVYVECIY